MSSLVLDSSHTGALDMQGIPLSLHNLPEDLIPCLLEVVV